MFPFKTTLRFAPLFSLWAAFHLGAEPSTQPHHEFIFPPETWHNHGSCLVEQPNGDILVCWFHGSGERQADDVKILGSRLNKKTGVWCPPFEMADTPEMPDTNCCMLIDRNQKLWLFWPTIQDNRWESALMKYKTSTRFETVDGAPVWDTEKVMHFKPGEDFPHTVKSKTAAYLSHKQLHPEAIIWAANNFKMAEEKLTRRLGWFTRAHPVQSTNGRILLGLYSDGFSFSMTAFSDDDGKSWQLSEPMVGGGNIQPSYAESRDGVITAYMRDNGPPPYRVQVSESADGGETWGPVYDHPHLANPGSGLELMRLKDGRWLFTGNDTENGRHRLLVALSSDEGKTFPMGKYIEEDVVGGGRFHYPSVIEGSDGRIHMTYSHFKKDPNSGQELKSIRYATFPLSWLEGE